MRTPKQERSTKKATEVRIALGNHKSKNANVVITTDETFTVQAFVERLGTTRSHLIDMRRRGLKVRKDGDKFVRITGIDYLEYLLSLPVAVLDPKDEDHSND